tara:strand:+ start:2114 stop:2299 length:186 start_codon:yes stop_codon:yes gene_type:complete
MITHNRLSTKKIIKSGLFSRKRLELIQILKYDVQINPIKPGDVNNIVGWDILNYLGIRGGA